MQNQKNVHLDRQYFNVKEFPTFSWFLLFQPSLRIEHGQEGIWRSWQKEMTTNATLFPLGFLLQTVTPLKLKCYESGCDYGRFIYTCNLLLFGTMEARSPNKKRQTSQDDFYRLAEV